MSVNEIDAKCRGARQLQNLIEEAQQEADAIKAALTAQGVDEARAGELQGDVEAGKVLQAGHRRLPGSE